MGVADFYAQSRGNFVLGDVPVDAVHFEFVADEILLAADNDAGCFGVDVHDVERLGRTTGQAFALADGEHLDAFVIG